MKNKWQLSKVISAVTATVLALNVVLCGEPVSAAVGINECFDSYAGGDACRLECKKLCVGKL